jgi:hypothetical protein
MKGIIVIPTALDPVSAKLPDIAVMRIKLTSMIAHDSMRRNRLPKRSIHAAPVQAAIKLQIWRHPMIRV